MTNDVVTIVCYNQKTYMERKAAIEYFTTAVLCSEGSERERYGKILAELQAGYMLCTDN